MSRARKFKLAVKLAAEDAGHPWPGLRWFAVGVDFASGGCACSNAHNGTAQSGRDPSTAQVDDAAELELRADDIVAYRVNLANGVPSLYVVIDDATGGARHGRPVVRLISASPFRVQSIAETGTAMVCALPMPPPLVEALEQFIDENAVIDTPSGSACGLAVKFEERFFGDLPLSAFPIGKPT